MPTRKWNAITDLLDYTDRVDPNNTRTKQMRDYVKRLQPVTEAITRLQEKAAKTKGGLTATESLELAQHHLSLGHATMAANTVRRLLLKPEANDFNILYLSATILYQCEQRVDAANAMKRALPLAKQDLEPRIRREMWIMFVAGGMMAEAETCLVEYLRVQPNDAEGWLQLALVEDSLNKTYEAQNAIYQAYQANQQLFNKRLNSSEKLQKIAAPLFKRQ